MHVWARGAVIVSGYERCFVCVFVGMHAAGAIENNSARQGA